VDDALLPRLVQSDILETASKTHKHFTQIQLYVKSWTQSPSQATRLVSNSLVLSQTSMTPDYTARGWMWG